MAQLAYQELSIIHDGAISCIHQSLLVLIHLILSCYSRGVHVNETEEKDMKWQNDRTGQQVVPCLTGGKCRSPTPVGLVCDLHHGERA